MMQTTTQNVVVVPGHDGSTYPNYSKKSSMVLGIFHLVILFVAFVACVVGIALVNLDGQKGSLIISMVGSAVYVAAGICAVVGGCNAKRGVVIASTVLNIICSVLAVINVITFMIAIVALHAALGGTRPVISDEYDTTILAICYVLFFVFLAQAVITIWTSAIGCSVTCCGATNQTNPPIVVTGAPVVVPMHGEQMQQTSYGYDQPADGYNPGAGMPPKQ
ncbi:hypothetical protein NP493_409g02034 [Ridgeia piscesae]|uniref:Membrane-spanning 4-domains subfamily A member 4A-like n=1 Tax=Ridgeia piscesae TaxID=27915 RepID=A0AAD9L228_RIDPI|nr:hypothetical protein NP493_409g02034 [Ridgeia piscesae]